MSGFLMVRMLGFVGDGLGGSQSPDDEETENQQTGERAFHQPVRHRQHYPKFRVLMVLEQTAARQS